MMRSKVLLPQPLAPTTLTMRPPGTVSSMSRSASTRPPLASRKVLDSRLNTRSAVSAATMLISVPSEARFPANRAALDGFQSEVERLADQADGQHADDHHVGLR